MSVLSLSNLIYGGGYAEGAKTITQNKPMIDGNIDVKDATFPRLMRQQINYLNVNEPDIPAIVSSMVAKMMGATINIQVESKYPQFNAQAEAYIEDHCGYEYINGNEVSVGELSGLHHFNSSSRNMAAFTVLNGGIIVRHHYNPIWRIPYRYELVGVDMIDISKTDRLNVKEGATTSTINGIVRDQFGQITDVWLYSTISKIKSEKVPYNQLTYFHEVWVSIDQLTAVSKLTSILNRLDMSTQYGIAELEAAIEEAKAGHFIESSAYSELMKIVGEEINKATNGAKTSAERIGAVKDLVTPILKDLANLGVKTRGLTPIPTGDKPIFNNTKRDSIYNDMNSNSDMKIASSQGMSDIGIFSKASEANYSAIKFVNETDQLSADIKFNDLSQRVFFAIFSRVIEVGVQTGAISAMRASYWKNPKEFHKFRYLRQNKIDIEPAKNAMANKVNLEMGLTDEGEIVERDKGIKYEVFLQNVHENAKLRVQYEVELEKFRTEQYAKAGIAQPNQTQGTTNG